MRRAQYTLSHTDVCGFAIQMLIQALAFLPKPRSVTAERLVQLLVQAAAEMRSLWAACLNAVLDCKVETIRLAVQSWLPARPEHLLPGLLAALHQRLPKSLKQRPRTMAIDLHLKPYYGDRRTPGTVRGQLKLGTRLFFAYATLLVLRKGQTYTVGVLPVRPKQAQSEIIATLLTQAAALGLRPRVLLLDRGFYGAPTIQYLQAEKLAFVMPMIRRGQKTNRGNRRFFVPGRRGWDQYTWTSRSLGRDGKPVGEITVAVCMAPRKRPRRGQKGPLVFACAGIHRSSAEIAELYRTRFRIETSYRQMREGLAKTCSTSATFRLLLIGIALVLRNLWVWLHWEYLARGRGHSRQRRLAKLRLRTMLRWIAHALEELLGQQLMTTVITPAAA
jgi:IS4 transposase